MSQLRTLPMLAQQDRQSTPHLSRSCATMADRVATRHWSCAGGHDAAPSGSLGIKIATSPERGITWSEIRGTAKEQFAQVRWPFAE